MTTLGQKYAANSDEKSRIDLFLESVSVSKNRRKKLWGVGVNDCKFLCSSTINGKRVEHSAYRAWKDMLARCYSKNTEYRTYCDCYVCDEWLVFSAFYSWWKEHAVIGWEIDKDLLITGNQQYCPKACIYIPKKLNSFTVSRLQDRGKFPIGVCFDKAKGLFMSSISDAKGKRLFLGYFSSPEAAHERWLAEKIKIAHGYRSLCDSIHPLIFDGLIRKVNSMK